MFAPAIGRVVRSPNTLPAHSVCTLGRPAVISAASQTPFRPSHQRRLSSSKASVPPDGSNTNGSSSAQQTPANASKAPAKKVASRTNRKRASTVSSAPVPKNVPRVPPTDHLQKPDVKVSSFFSLHRPISLERAIPPVASNTSIKTLFTPRSPYSKRMTAENIQTLSNGIESLEAALRAHEKQAPEDLLQPEVQHLDSHPQVSLEELMARFVPFRPPPPPAVFGEGAEPHATKAIEDEVVTLPVTHRTWSTKVLVTESTDSAGNLTYSATTAPMVEVFGPGAENGQETEQFAVRQPFLARMSQRVYANSRDVQRPDMQAISVKRQRKLKMKKHKYKKLMKRTRLLRRKLDRN